MDLVKKLYASLLKAVREDLGAGFRHEVFKSAIRVDLQPDTVNILINIIHFLVEPLNPVACKHFFTSTFENRKISIGLLSDLCYKISRE